MTAHARQWGGRFAEPPDPLLQAYGSSLEDDLILAPFDVRCSHAHVEALLGGGIVSSACADELHAALDTVLTEIESGEFAPMARAQATSSGVAPDLSRRSRSAPASITALSSLALPRDAA